jgi:hypothetical protein
MREREKRRGKLMLIGQGKSGSIVLSLIPMPLNTLCIPIFKVKRKDI